MGWPPLRGLLLYMSTISPWKALAIIFALLNIKNLPLAWHVSVPSSTADSLRVLIHHECYSFAV